MKFHAPIVVGGQSLAYIENEPRLRSRFSVDYVRRMVLVSFQMSNGDLAQALVPFENVAAIQCETLRVAAPAAGA